MENVKIFKPNMVWENFSGICLLLGLLLGGKGFDDLCHAKVFLCEAPLAVGKHIFVQQEAPLHVNAGHGAEAELSGLVGLMSLSRFISSPCRILLTCSMMSMLRFFSITLLIFSLKMIPLFPVRPLSLLTALSRMASESLSLRDDVFIHVLFWSRQNSQSRLRGAANQGNFVRKVQKSPKNGKIFKNFEKKAKY